MAPGLCENCHKRPKSGTHRFCGKTCAAQAAAKPVRSKKSQSQSQVNTGPRNGSYQRGPPSQKPVQLCIYCGQKPKFNNSDYCCKSCAALASAAQTKPPVTPGKSIVKQKTTRAPNTPAHNTRAQVRVPAGAPRTKPAVAQADDSTEEDEETEEEDAGGASTDLDAYPSDSGSESEGEVNAPAVAAFQPRTKRTPKGSKLRSSAPSITPGTCAIPGCGQPSHVDRNGVKTMYCSVRHREEAVKQGLAEACIMCKKYPQSNSDYFCSSACRNQSMTKT